MTSRCVFQVPRCVISIFFGIGLIYVWFACKGLCLIVHRSAVQTGPRKRRQKQQQLF